ncbi:MAG TPA: acetate kinase [Nostocaceae cyanobacterium]|nr:acetate kinase [Nostocaceae cyanobacterium]
MKILVLNAGSSTQKSCLYEINDQTSLVPHPLWEAKIDWNHQPGQAEIEVKTATGKKLEMEMPVSSRPAVISYLLKTLTNLGVIADLSEISVVGHRVVHGGEKYQSSVIISEEVKEAIAQLSTLAPAHNPAAVEGITAVGETLSNIPQVAVFDTAFHRTLPDAAAIYPGPYEWVEAGIRRYGFHGISHQYCAFRAAQILEKDLADLRLISCHLGNGCSLTAIKNGVSINTTMGFTPLDGLMMGSRSGSIDPGIVIYLLRKHSYSADQLDQILNKNSGLKGISGISSDLREIIKASKEGNQRAQLAWEIYVHRLKSGIGAMLASLGGLDALIFTAGVGENSAAIREVACTGWEFLGLKLDLDKNQQQPIDTDISASDSRVKVLVIQTQEDWAIARQCYDLLK